MAKYRQVDISKLGDREKVYIPGHEIPEGDNLDVCAEVAAKALVDSGEVYYEREFIALPGLKDGERVEVTIRRFQPVKLPVEWGATIRVPVGAGT